MAKTVEGTSNWRRAEGLHFEPGQAAAARSLAILPSSHPIGVSEKPSSPPTIIFRLFFVRLLDIYQPATHTLRPPFAMDRLRPLILFEAIVVVGMWTSAILVPISLIDRVHQTLPDVCLDPSVELRILSSVLLLALELYVRRMLGDLFRGIGFQPYNALRHQLFTVVWWVLAAIIQGAPLRGARWAHRQALLNMLYHSVSNHSEESPAKLDAPDATLPAYAYNRLSGSRSIRLITFDARKDGATTTAPISCSMQEVPLDSAPPFVALSYAWDSHEGTQEIACDGARLIVTRNCVEALHNIRERPFSGEKHVWVDAICINQAATPEKHRQISIMADIYRTASSVRVWLGQEDASSKLVCDFFGKISGTEEFRRIIGAGPGPGPISTGLETAQQWPQFSKSLADFFSRSWFTRAWPIQEVTLPRPGRVYVVCGSRRLPLKYIRVGWDVLRELDILPASALHDQPVALQFYLADAIALKRGLAAPVPERPQGRLGNPGLDFGKPLLADLSQFSFTSVMHSMRFKACRDAKDRFFSLYGVFEELEIDHGISISMWTETDAEVFRAVALACFKLERHLGALRLAQLPDPYIRLSDDLLLSSRRNPYDGLSTSMFAMTGRFLSVARNIKDGREVCYHAPTSVRRTTLPSWAPDWTLPTPAHVDAERQISLISASAVARPDDEDADGATAIPVLKGPHLLVDIKTVGRITDLGTVDSAQLLWQVLSNGMTVCPSRTHRSDENTALDPTLSAAAETISNHIWSHAAQILVSLRMARRTLDFLSLWTIGTSAYTSAYFRSRIYELLCNRFPSVASCPTDGAGMRARLHQLGGIRPLYEGFEISKAIIVFSNVRSWIDSDLLHQLAAKVCFTVGGLFWDFRVSLLETLLGSRYEHINWVVALPILGLLISDSVQTVAGWIDNSPMYLLAWSLGVAAKLGFLLTVVVWAWRARVLQLFVVIIIVPRMMRGPVWFIRSLFGAAHFRKSGAYTHGVHFFAADTGILGSTSSPVLQGDSLVKVRGSKGCLILRPAVDERGGNDSYVVVGAAHLGTQDLLDRVVVDEVWSQVELC